MRVGLLEKTALVVGVLFLLVGNAFIIYENYDTEWRYYQKEYLRLAAEKADDLQMGEILEARSPRIEQLVVTQFGERQVDRCTTCHAGVDDPRFVDEPQPFTTHPDVAGDHSYTVFGCTSCHAGNGRGLSVKDGHGEVEFWTEPLLKGEYIETSCAKCHPDPFIPETPLLAKGAALFESQACYGCHRVEGVSNGRLGVELTDVGAKWPIDYIVESIVEPKANNIDSIMPIMELTEDEVKALSIYLKSLTGENLVEGSVSKFVSLKAWSESARAEVSMTLESGRKVYEDMACNACHMIRGEGGQIGPDLSVYGLQRTKEWMIQHHINPRSLVGGSVMPDFEYSQSELEAVSLYLEAQTSLTDSITERDDSEGEN